MSEDFYERARALGHSVDALKAGHAITTTIASPM